MSANPTISLEFEPVDQTPAAQTMGVRLQYTDGTVPAHLLFGATSLIKEVAKQADSIDDHEFADRLREVANQLHEVTATREVTRDDMF